MDVKKIREDFPALAKNHRLIYFDNACTTLKPRLVIDAITAYYSEYSACAGRSNHALSRKTDEEYSRARESVAKFVRARPESVVFMRNATEAINTVAEGFDFSSRRIVVLSNLEHHSLLLPFQRLAQEGKITLRFVKADSEGKFKIDDWKAAITRDVALVGVHHTTNTTGTTAPVKEIAKLAHDNGARLLIDAAQGAAHAQIDFASLDADFLAFSAHKMCGPTGIGALVGKSDALERLRTHNIGGETVLSATLESNVMLPVPKRFEAGIQHYAGAIGFGASCEYLSKFGMQNIASHEKTLITKMQKLLEEEKKLSGKLTIIGPKNPSDRHSAILAFNIKGITPHQVSISLDKLSGIAVRSGLFCAHPAMQHFGARDGAVRASLYLYNNEEELSAFAQTLAKISELS